MRLRGLQDVTKWEYKVVVGHPQLIEAELNKLGATGWEVASMAAMLMGKCAVILKREAAHRESEFEEAKR